MTTKTQQLLTITLKTVLRYVATMAMTALVLWAVWSVHHWLLTALCVIAALLLAALPAASVGMKAYRASVRATKEHQEYLMGNGATRHEALLPSRQRGIRAALVYTLRAQRGATMLITILLLTTLLLVGVSPVKATLLVVLLTIASLLAGVALTLLFMWNTERQAKA